MVSTTTGQSKLTVKQWAEVLAMLRNLPQPPRRWLLHGVPGTGKTTWACSLQEQYERKTMTLADFPDSLFGKFLLRDGSTVWSDAPAARAAKRGCPLILDELHKASGEVSSALQSILDDESVCKLNLDNGESITPQQGYMVIATMNGSPDQLDEAVLDRFDVVMKCNTPHVGILKRLSPECAAFIANKMANEPEPEAWVPMVTPRRMLAFEHLRKQSVDDSLAADIVFGEGQGKVILMSLVDAARNVIR